MERKELHQKIADLTDLISVNNDRLFLHDDKIAQIEIDLLRKNAIELYEQINLLHITNLRVKEQATMTRAEHDSEAIQAEKELEVEEEPTIAVEEKIVKEVPVAEEETKETEKPATLEEEALERPEEETIPEIIEEKPQPQTKLFEVIEENKETPKAVPAEKPGKESKTHIYEKYRQSKIDSIKKSISILKKYEYQNQLFGKDPKAYTEAIEMLDQAASMDVALSLFENSLAKKYHWSDEDSLVEELRELVLRRHS